MKKRSKLFLLIAGIIFSIGIIVCLIAVSVAHSSGEQLFAEKIGDGYGYTYDFGDGKIDKIKISVTDANVNIYGGQEKSYIEIINFNENTCSYTGNNAIITFREVAEIKDITGIWENGLSFKGLRYFLRHVSSDDQKVVNIYLEKSEHVKAFDIKLGKGNVTIQDIDMVTDYSVTLDSGKVSVSDITTESAVNVTSTGDMSSDIIFENVSASITKIKAKRAKFVGEEFKCDDCEINVTTGSADFDFIPLNERYSIEVHTKGKLIVDGVTCPDSYSYPPDGEEAEDAEGVELDENGEIIQSSLYIDGADFSVTLDTPATAEEQTEEITE